LSSLLVVGEGQVPILLPVVPLAAEAAQAAIGVVFLVKTVEVGPLLSLR
jgi:hypothetical protein